MQSLDKRLHTVASLVRRGSRVADVGTDHAYLPVWLVEEGVCPKAIASDIGEGPLAAARRTVEAAGLAHCIDLRLGDGLAPVAAGEVEDIAIAGMGGETIAAILEAAPWVKDPCLRLVLQPMSRAEDLRRWLLTNGFTVETERLVRDGRHLYPVMAARYTGDAPPMDDYRYYAGFFTPEEGKPYREMMAAHLARRADGLARAGETAQAARLVDIANRLRAAYSED